MTERYQFDASYQALCIAVLLRHQAELSYAVPCLKANYFGSVEATLTAEQALSYYAQYDRFPSFTVLAELVAAAEAKLSGERDAESSAVEYARSLEDVDTADWKHVANSIVEFAREKALYDAIKKSIDYMKEQKEPPGGFGPMFDEARNVGANLGDLGLILHMDVEATVDKVTSEEYGIRTGFALLDDIWKMGWKPGWLVVLLAPPKGLKTTTALNLALNMVSPEQGYDVIYYACEINQDLAMMRALCALSGMEMDEAYSTKEGFIAKSNEVIGQRVAGTLLFKSFSSKSTTISDLRAHAKLAIQQISTPDRPFKPKAIYIDYAETIKPGGRGKDEADYRQQANIYTDARALAGELGCVVVMPDRCNRETVDSAVPNMKSFQGAFEKAGIVDVAIGVCITPEEFLRKQFRLFVFLNRHGPPYQHIRGHVDLARYTVYLDELIAYEPEGKDDEDAPPRRRSANSAGRSIKAPVELIDDR